MKVRFFDATDIDLLEFDHSKTLFIVSKSKDTVPELDMWCKGELGFDVKTAEPITYREEDFMVGTGIKVAYPSDCLWGLYVLPRSSTSTKMGLTLSNSCGVIDPSYRGEIKLPFHVVDTKRFKNFCESHGGEIPIGIRMAQCVLFATFRPNIKMYLTPLDVVVIVSDELYDGWEDLMPSYRGSGGFGSTGY